VNVLHIDSSPLLESSVTRVLTARIVERILESRPEAEVTVRDVGRRPPGHATAEVLAFLRSKQLDGLATLDAEDKTLSDQLVHELLAADMVVIGAPMHNFTVTTQLKAWIDRVCRAGVTFRYTPEGAIGLTNGKRAVIAAARGGFYSTPDQARRDFQITYLKEILSFVGISDVAVVLAEGVNISPEQRARSMDEATRQIDALFRLPRERTGADDPTDPPHHPGMSSSI
jgi:FMN-dependent NADH-azoreductase